MFKSQKPIIFTMLLALLGIGATVAIGVGISVRDSVNPEESSAAIINKTTEYKGFVSCLSSAGFYYTKSNLGMVRLTMGAYDEPTNKVVSPIVTYTSTISKDGNYIISGTAPQEYSFSLLEVALATGSNTINPLNCLSYEKLVSDSGREACLNTPLEMPSPSICSDATISKPISPAAAELVTGKSKYLCERDTLASSYKGFDFQINNCLEPLVDLSTTAINTSTTISKNSGDTLTMYFNGENLSDYKVLNTTYYLGEQGLRDIYSSYRVYYCNNSSDTDCTSEVILPTYPPEDTVSPWRILAVIKDKKIKIEGKLLTTAKNNIPIKIQYAQLPSPLLPLLKDSNEANNVWTGNVSIVAPVPVASTTSTSASSVTSINSSVTTSSSRSVTSTRSTSSNRSVVSTSSSTASTVATQSSSSEQSSITSEGSTSSRSTSSIKPYVPVTTPSSNDNTTLILALVALLVLFLVSLFVVYRKYKGDKEVKEEFTTSPKTEVPPTPTPSV